MPKKRAAKSVPSSRRSTAKRGSRDSKHPRNQRELVIITGMSGAGKASALKAFEDLGYYAVDNLPVGLIDNFAELVWK
jgi:RNase adapter protein RapZ